MADLEAIRHEAIRLLCAAQAKDLISVDGFQDRLARIRQAENRATLAAITADIEGTSGLTPLPVPFSAPAPAEADATWTSVAFAPADHLRIASVLGSTKRAGSWTVPLALDLHIFFGEMTIDLRDAVFASDSLDIDLDLRFGSFTLIVPPGVQIENEVREVMSSSTHSVRDATDSEPIGLLIRLRGSAFAASIEVKERARTRAKTSPGGFLKRLLNRRLPSPPGGS